MSLAFSSSEQHALQRQVETTSSERESVDNVSFENDMQITSVVEWCKKNAYKAIAVQLPDSMLGCAVRLHTALNDHFGEEHTVYLLADSTYASCCVDVVTAAHVRASCCIHYGDACLSPPASQLPVMYVWPRASIDCARMQRTLGDESMGAPTIGRVVVVYELVYAHAHDEIVRAIQRAYAATKMKICVARPQNVPDDYNANTFVDTRTLGRRWCDVHGDDGHVDDCHVDTLNTSATALLYIGRHSGDSALLTLTQWMLPNVQRTCVYDPTVDQVCTSTTSTYTSLRRRLYLVGRVRDAQRVGIICSTVGVRKHRHTVHRLMDLCTAAGKSYYVLSVGKLNVAKIANFTQDIEVFVNVSCPFGILMQDKVHEHHRPIVSVFEAYAALDPAQKWMADRPYIFECTDVLASIPSTTDDGQEGVDLSLISGRIHSTAAHTQGEQNQPHTQVQLYSAGDYFSSRTWHGMNEGLDSVLTVQPNVPAGRAGVARGYTNEPKKDESCDCNDFRDCK